jgi:ssDNA-binding Zn-finger/Zn-ribbon topoisomerase 1
VNEPREHPVTCPFCGRPMRLKTSRHGPFYGCAGWPRCSAKVGAHTDGRPMGVAGDSETRTARRRAHSAFDKLWRKHGWSRSAAYRWLADRLGIPYTQCHIGLFDAPRCYRVIELVETETPNLKVTRAAYRTVIKRPSRRRYPKEGPAAPARTPKDLNDAREMEEQRDRDHREAGAGEGRPAARR